MRRLLPRVIALAPGGEGGLGVVLAAGRARALGVLDLVGVEPGRIVPALDRLGRFEARPYGIRIEAASHDALARVEFPSALEVLVVLGGDATDWPRLVSGVSRTGRVLLAEVVSRSGARAAFAAGVDGVIVAGNEAGGRCAAESSLILLQGVRQDATGPIWVRGGIGPLGASACVAAGAWGVVLDGALLLARESPLDEAQRALLGRLDGSETQEVRLADGSLARTLVLPGSNRNDWPGELHWGLDGAWPVGQDSALAAPLARRFGTTGGIIQEVELAIVRGIEQARRARPLAPGSPLAIAHGTTFPIVQGPMTRVSDTAAFALAVADSGGLPFLALAMMSGLETRQLLGEVAARLGERTWGVGLLGFVAPELRREQMEAIREHRPSFALIAGGRPDQAAELEQLGMATYLHAPSPGLLDQYVRSGARRLVLEGRECGGHVGPRSSLVLWEQGVSALLDLIAQGRVSDPSELHLLFAGGIHDARSAAAVAALAAPLAERGARIGVLVGTAYLFTSEAIATGAIVPRYQAEAVRCSETVLLKTGPGHEVRVAPSPFTSQFESERRQRLDAGVSALELREALEKLNVGRLRLASKGLERTDGRDSPLASRPEDQQYERGLYMLGQVATLRAGITTMTELHEAISTGSGAWLDQLPIESPGRIPRPKPNPSDVAIVGMSAIFPGSADLRTFWDHTLLGLDAIIEVPPDRWDWQPYYDRDPKAPDRITSKWGGFVPDIPFDPLRYGMPPSSLPSIEPVQLLVLEAVRSALADAGYDQRAFPRERTAVVLGMGGGAAQLAMGYAFRSYLPMLDPLAPDAAPALRRAAEKLLPEWTEDSFPGFLLNVTAGRVANRFNLGGANYTVDAACGSSLAAASVAVRELESGAADVVILGGADTVQNPFTYLAFSKTQAFSPRGRCRPFDASADGIVISEGVGVVVLKRLADAERDGDRIYAVIKGIGCSSDGRSRGLTAPCGDGQAAALHRAYEKAGLDPASVGYVEAHGTGTAVGDVVEVNALAAFLREAGAERASTYVGSIKSMIGHTKCAAGLAGLINASMALHHAVIPPTIGVETLNPNADLNDSPLQVTTTARPWFHTGSRPRRAGVSAFGFGGTNFHAVLEAYERDPTPRLAPMRAWPVELLVWTADSPETLHEKLEKTRADLERNGAVPLRELAHALAIVHDRGDRCGPKPKLAIVAATIEELRAKLDAAGKVVMEGANPPPGVFYSPAPVYPDGKTAWLFPGQGAQALDMLGDLAVLFEEVRSGYEAFDEALRSAGRAPITPRVFPPTTLDHAGRERARLALMATDVAQPAVGAASVGLLRLLEALGIAPDLVAGHSYGELPALHAAGALSVADLAVLSEARGRLMLEAARPEPGGMAALLGDPTQVAGLIASEPGVVVANLNGPRQTVIAGPRDALARAVDRAREQGLRAHELAVSCAFHTDLVAPAAAPFAELAAGCLAAPRRPVFANLDGRPHPPDPAEIAQRLGRHIASPVRFAEMVEALYDAGARVFVECGPGSTLTTLVGTILGDRPHLAVGLHAAGRPGLPTLLNALARLAVAGVPVRLRRLTAGRASGQLDLDRLDQGHEPGPGESTWLVNGSRVKPIHGPEPIRLGQRLETPLPPIEVASAPERSPESPSRRTPIQNGSNGHQGESHGPFEPSRLVPPGRNGTGFPHAGTEPAFEPGDDGALPTIEVDAAETDSVRVLESFHETMRTFLEVQQATMLAYLDSRKATKAPTTPSQPAARSAEPKPNGPGAQPVPSPAPSQVEPPHAPGVVSEPTPVRVSTPTPALEEPRVADRLLAIVRERTGYPTEMLNPQLDLEADLGIDSIKRVEIVGTLRDTLPGLDRVNDSTFAEGLARSRTLGEIITRVETALRSTSSSTVAPRSNVSTTARSESSRTPLRRLVLHVVDAPLEAPDAGPAAAGLILLTEDGRGVARALRDRYVSQGHDVALLDPARLDTRDPAAFRSELDAVRGARRIAGIIHTATLGGGPAAGLDPSLWSQRLDRELRFLFLLARYAADDLRHHAPNGSFLIAATALGGTFAADSLVRDDFFPGQGGIAGLVKTMAREWPEIRTRVVDFDRDEPAETIVDRLLVEAGTEDSWAEVGYRGDRRVRLETTEAPLAKRSRTLDLPAGAPVVVTGGARGITAAITVELARRWKPTLLLLGSSPLPPDREDAITASLTDPAEIKAALYEQGRGQEKTQSPAALEQAFRSLMKGRQIRETLQRIQEAGAVVEYVAADVRDENAVRRALDGWRRKYGEPAGLIHGAGVIHDKLLKDKTIESFDRVLETKLAGALNLAREVQPGSLRFTVLFSSIAGRFGNQGQSDYAAANEILNKLAVWLDRRWPGRVLAVNWGPWAGVGMVSELERHLGRRGLGMIAPDDGCAALIDELERGRKGEVEVILAGELGNLDQPLRSSRGRRAEVGR